MRAISTDVQVLISASDWRRIAAVLPENLQRSGYEPTDISAEVIDLTCQPDNMLIAQYQQEHGHVPPSLLLHRVVINGRSAMNLRAATRAVVDSLPPETHWYGTSHEGPSDPGASAACAWQG